MKRIQSILVLAVLLMALAVPILSVPVMAADSENWYKTVNGVLNTDDYTLYPFSTTKSLKIGFSKFGEMINSNDNVGLEYGAVDPFAPAAGSDISSIVKSAWLNGWLCNITYYHTIRSELRTVWVSAQHGDPNGVTYGGNWIRVDFANDYSITYGLEDPRDPGYIIGNYAAGAINYGGRKTNGTAVTSAMQVLYDGPRSFVALLKTTVYDHFLYGSDSTTEDIPLLEVRFMISFNKVKKEVVVFKELKTLVPDKYTDVLKVQFSNRGEVDLGTEAGGYASYFHFYTQGTSQYNSKFNDTEAINTQIGLTTPYDRNWVLNTTENPSTTAWPNFSASGPYPQTSAATYDLAVAINPSGMFGYTWWAAFWPSLSDWSIDGWPMWWRSMSALDPHDIDSRTWETYPRNEPTIPFYIGEWDVELKPKGKTTPAGGFDQQQYRFVTVYGVTDLNDGKDLNQLGGSNIIDREIKFQLDEVFTPWDLTDAVHKTTRTWVEWKTSGTTFTSSKRPVINVANSMWDQYNTQSERVVLLSTNTLLKRVKYVGGYAVTGDYTFSVNSNGYMVLSGLPSGACKIIYDTLPEVIATQTTTISTAQYANNATSVIVPARTLSANWTDNIGVGHGYKVTFPEFTVYADISTYANWTQTWTLQKLWNETDFKVFLGETYVSTIPNMFDPINVTNPEADLRITGFLIGGPDEVGRVTFLFDIDTLEKNVTATSDPTVIAPLPKETTHVLYLNHTLDITVTVTNVNITGVNSVNNTLTATFTTTMKADYDNKLMGRYEWGTVGRDAASVDSAGLSLISAAFKEKQVEYGLSGADMFTPLDASGNAANQMPWVMSKFGAGTSWSDYYKAAFTDNRTGLRDDWCKAGTVSGDEVPVARSNMIGVGGPLANLLAYYGNDYTNAFYGFSTTDKGDYTNYAPWEGKIVPKTCWDHAKGYTSNNTIGYAVVSTYLDINGTAIFLVWGNWGRDTLYASKWFFDEGVYQLQEAPAGLTDIIVQINYESTGEGYKPTSYKIVECLGTISERLWYHEWSTPFWEGAAYSATGAAVTTPTLQSGKTYRIVASEIFWYNQPANLAADAMYYTTDPSDHWQWVNHFPAPGGHSFLQINGADVNWGPFSNGDTGHTYSITYVGQGSPITFQIVDWMDQNYTNNICHIPISIYIAEYKGGIHDP